MSPWRLAWELYCPILDQCHDFLWENNQLESKCVASKEKAKTQVPAVYIYIYIYTLWVIYKNITEEEQPPHQEYHFFTHNQSISAPTIKRGASVRSLVHLCSSLGTSMPKNTWVYILQWFISNPVVEAFIWIYLRHTCT